MLKEVFLLYRNQNSHFANLPQANIQRSVMDRSCSHKTSFNAGEVVPLYLDMDILPGDTVSITTSKVVRLQTLLRPIFDDLYLDTYWWFIPMRLTWEHTKQFFGENTESAWIPETEYTIPKILSPEGGFEVGTLADYMGLPVGVDFTSERLPSALPFRAYALVMNEFFRDQNLTDPLNIPLGDANQQGSNGTDYINDVANGGKPFIAAKFFDYFSSCLPSPQKGSPVRLPIGDFSNVSLPVYSSLDNIDTNKYYGATFGFDNFAVSSDLSISQAMRFGDVQFTQSGDPPGATFTNPGKSNYVGAGTGTQTLTYEPGEGAFIDFADASLYPWNASATIGQSHNGKVTVGYPINLFADASGISSAPSVSINDLRMAFAMQEYLELLGRGGSRYIEIIRSQFGIVSPDARLQRPEYLGGNRIRLDVSAVANHTQAPEDFLGDLGANSVTIDVHADFTKSFTEHGILLGVGVVRYNHTYSQGMQRGWFRTTRTDFYTPVFANIGEQPVYKDELYYQGNSDVFGYNEAWADYRYNPNRVSSEMRPGIPNTLDSWHLADDYAEAPTLSDAWIREDKAMVDRVLSVGSENANQIFGDFYFKVKHTRPMPMYSIPALLGRG